MEKSCCFVGHRQIEISDALVARLNDMIEALISKGVTIFRFGSRSAFNSLCHRIVSELKKKYPHVVRIAYDTKSESSLLEEEREETEKRLAALVHKAVRLEGFEAVVKPDVVSVSGKVSYIARNHYMIDQSDVCVFYYDESYVPVRRQISAKSAGGIWTSAKSGTADAYRYAIRKGKTVINVK